MRLVEWTRVGFVMERMNVLVIVRKIGRQVSSGLTRVHHFSQELPQIFSKLPRAEHGLQSGPTSQPPQAHFRWLAAYVSCAQSSDSEGIVWRRCRPLE